MTKHHSVEEYIENGKTLLDKGDYEAAIAHFSSALALKGYDPVALRLRAVAAVKARLWKQAGLDFADLTYIEPNDKELWLMKGLTRYEGWHDYLPALQDITRAIEIDPNYADAYYQRAVLRHREEGYEEAIPDLDKAVFLGGPCLPKALYGRATAHMKTGRFKQCRQDIERLMQVDPDPATALVMRGRLHRCLHNKKAAIDDFSEAIKAGHGCFHVLRMRADLLLDEMQYAEAKADYDELVKAAPKDAVLRAKLGRCLLELGGLAQAKDVFKEALRLDPRSLDGLVGIGAVLKHTGELGGALEALTQALEVDGKRAEAYFARGEVYAINGEQEKALSDFTRAAGLSPFVPEHHVALSRAFLQLGYGQKALEAAERALFCSSEHAAAQRAREDALDALGKQPRRYS